MMKDIGYHRHVVCMLACCTQGMTIALVMEFMPCGDLQTFLKKHRNAEAQVISWLEIQFSQFHAVLLLCPAEGDDCGIISYS